MRFSENEYHDPARLDFVPRQYRGQIARMIAIFSLCLVAVLLVGVLQVGRASGLAPILSLFIIIFVSMYALILKQRDIDHVVNTEYQNMLFAQGIALGSAFYLFVRMDGTIGYSSDGLRKLFPRLHDGGAQSLDTVLEYGGVRTIDRDRLMKAVNTCVADRMVLPIPVNGEPKDYVITVDPLPRPAGMLLVRGRQFRDARAGTQLLPDVLRSTSAEKLDHMLSTSPTAHYTTDGFGEVEYANPAFEQLLGYAEGEVIGRKIPLRDIIQSFKGDAPANETAMIEYSGNVTLKRKGGGTLHAMLFQSLIRDSAGKLTAATGSILPFSAGQE